MASLLTTFKVFLLHLVLRKLFIPESILGPGDYDVVIVVSGDLTNELFIELISLVCMKIAPRQLVKNLT